MKIYSRHDINVQNINNRVNIGIDIYQYLTHTIEPWSRPCYSERKQYQLRNTMFDNQDDYVDGILIVYPVIPLTVCP